MVGCTGIWLVPRWIPSVEVEVRVHATVSWLSAGRSSRKRWKTAEVTVFSGRICPMFKVICPRSMSILKSGILIACGIGGRLNRRSGSGGPDLMNARLIGTLFRLGRVR